MTDKCEFGDIKNAAAARTDGQTDRRRILRRKDIAQEELFVLTEY